MKERPILFSGGMVNAILEGRKTQTRRVVKLSDRLPHSGALSWVEETEIGVSYPRPGWYTALVNAPSVGYTFAIKCPYGVPGDRLWTRETWQQFFEDEVPEGHPQGPRGTMGVPAQPERLSFAYYRADGDVAHRKDGYKALWKPSIHMPRWASRLTLEITGVKVERLQDISEEDAVAEGIPNDMLLPVPWYRGLWNQINGAGAWDKNPWVWAVSFKRIITIPVPLGDGERPVA